MPIDAEMNGHFWKSLKLIEDIYRIVRPLGLVFTESLFNALFKLMLINSCFALGFEEAIYKGKLHHVIY